MWMRLEDIGDRNFLVEGRRERRTSAMTAWVYSNRSSEYTCLLHNSSLASGIASNIMVPKAA